MSNRTVTNLKERIRSALKSWHQKDATTSPLEGLALLQTSLATHNDMRRATNHVLMCGLERMESRFPREAMLIRRAYLDNEKNHRLATEQNISEAKLYRDIDAAIMRLTEALLEQDVEAKRTRQASLIHRLEPPTYTQLVAVESHLQRLESVVLGQDQPWLISIEGIGGIGKTALADTLVRRLIAQGVIAEIGWVTARAETFDFGRGITLLEKPALTAEALMATLAAQLMPDVPLSPAHIQTLLQQRLKAQPHVIVIDNLETLADARRLLATLRSLANPTKFILTTRESLYAEPDLFAFPVPELDRPSALAFIRQEAARRNQKQLSQASDEMLQPIVETVGGNPLAIRLLIGQTHVHALSSVLANLQQAQGTKVEELYTYIYRQAWDQLDEAPRQVLLAMPLVTSYGATLAQLAATSAIAEAPLMDALELLVRLSLVDSVGSLHESRYTIHSLTRTFLHEQVLQWR
jgi:LuxR family glucitol operon transcriptional activator